MENATYKLNVICKNCKFEGEHIIKRGVKLDDAECPNCGCQTLIQKLGRARMTFRQEDCH